MRAQARILCRMGHDVRVYGPASAPLDPGETALCGAVMVRFGGTSSGIGLDPRAPWRVASVLGRHEFDVVHVHEPLVPLMPWSVLRQARVPVIATFHVHRETGHRWYQAARPWLRSLMRRVRYRIAVSEAARRTVAQHFPGPYRIVPNGVDVAAFQTNGSRPPVFSPGRHHILCVGRLEARKGTHHLIRAMAEVQRVRADTRLVIVGDGPERRALASLARSLSVDAAFTGLVPDGGLPAYMHAADVLCSPAVGGESFGLVVLEAMACGKPIVASRIEAYQTLVGAGGCGLLVPPGDAEALAGAILMLLADPPLREALGRRGAHAAQEYDWDAIGRALDEIYRHTLGCSALRPAGASSA